MACRLSRLPPRHHPQSLPPCPRPPRRHRPPLHLLPRLPPPPPPPLLGEVGAATGLFHGIGCCTARRLHFSEPTGWSVDCHRSVPPCSSLDGTTTVPTQATPTPTTSNTDSPQPLASGGSSGGSGSSSNLGVIIGKAAACPHAGPSEQPRCRLLTLKSTCVLCRLGCRRRRWRSLRRGADRPDGLADCAEAAGGRRLGGGELHARRPRRCAPQPNRWGGAAQWGALSQPRPLAFGTLGVRCGCSCNQCGPSLLCPLSARRCVCPRVHHRRLAAAGPQGALRAHRGGGADGQPKQRAPAGQDALPPHAPAAVSERFKPVDVEDAGPPQQRRRDVPAPAGTPQELSCILY